MLGMPEVKNIAIFLPNWVGDVVMATPTLRALREHFPQARIVHVGRPVALETLDGTRWADATICDRTRQPGRVGNFFSLLAALRRERFDLAVLLPNSFRVAAVAKLGKAKRIVGYARDGRGWLLTDKLQPRRDDHGRFVPVPTLDYYLELAAKLGAAGASRRMELAASDLCQEQAQQLLAQAGIANSGRVVLLNPGCSFGPSKLWPAERFAAVADALIERQGARIVINAAPSERTIAAQVAGAMKHAPSLNLADHSNSIGLLKALLSRCALLVTNDTGARHLAAAMGIGVVTIFGSTDPVWAQIDHPRERQIRASVPCSPCQSKTCPLPTGPTFHQCMQAVTAEEVLAAAEELLTSPPMGGRSHG